MKRLQIWALGALTLLSAGWLQADSADPSIKFNTGGSGSTDITCDTSGCITALSPTIGADGQASLDIFNESGLNINALTFYVPNTNFDQTFTASTNAFTNALILPNEAGDQLIVDFFGVGSAAEGGSYTLPADPSDPDGGSPGFEAGGTVTVQAFFGNAPAGSNFTGFANGQEAMLTLTPEPSMFWLSFCGLAGLLVARRKLRKT